MALFQSLHLLRHPPFSPDCFSKASEQSNEMVGLASLFGLPIAFRFLTGIAVDRRRGRHAKGGSLCAQIFPPATAVAGAISVGLNEKPLWLTLGLFALAEFFYHCRLSGRLDRRVSFLFAVRSESKAFYGDLKLQIYRVGIVIVQGL